MPGPRYFDPADVIRSSNGQFAPKAGTSPEVALDSYGAAVAEVERILREEVYEDGTGFSTRDVSVPVDTLRILLRGRAGQLVVDDADTQKSHAQARVSPEGFSPADDLP